ncbi:unnamed protein product, partial [marine sediment metagenome]
TTGDTEIEPIGYKFKGTKKKPIKLEINGNAGSLCGLYSQNSIFNIKGNVGTWCGYFSKNTTFNIEGNVGDVCGDNSSKNIFILKGNVGKHCGIDSNHNIFNIRGDVGKNCGYRSIKNSYLIEGSVGDFDHGYSETDNHYRTKNSTFKTPNKETYEKIKKELGGFFKRLTEGNKVELIE